MIARVVIPTTELVKLLNRAMNTMEPIKCPPWAIELTDNLRPTDSLELAVTRDKDLPNP